MGVSTPNLAPFPVDPELTAIAIAYRNPAYTLIADLVMPRVTPVLGVKAFKWWQHDLADGFTVPDTLVGRTGTPNKVEWSAEEKDGSCKDQALDEEVPQDDVDQAKNVPGNVNPLGDATERLTNLVTLGREKRVASIVFNPTNYAASNVTTLSGTSQFTGGDGGGDGGVGGPFDGANYGGGGGGAGGYTGSGGSGGGGAGGAGGAGTGGGGGGGGGYGGGGGGVGLYGAGPAGAGGAYRGGGSGGSGGGSGGTQSGIYAGSGGSFGGGGAGQHNGEDYDGSGGPGGVRVIWGPGATF